MHKERNGTKKNDLTQGTALEAVIYCRVSDPKQKSEGNGLDSQERICREYAKRRGYHVLETFHDDVTGSTSNRHDLHALFAFLKKNRGKGIVVIIDDLSRLGRDEDVYWPLRDAIFASGNTLEATTIKIGNTADEIFVERLLVNFGAHTRRKIVETTKSRMLGRMLNGYWCFHVPPGYFFEAERYRGKVIRIKPDVALVVKEAFEGYASGRFERQVDVQNWLQNQPLFPRSKTGIVRRSHVEELLGNPLYAGFIHKPDWGINMQRGVHPPIISVATWQRVQDRLSGIDRAPQRKNLNEDFPLRGFVRCTCGNMLTACWSKGRSKTYAYYVCQRSGCPSYGKSVRREKIEGDFEELLKSIQPTKNFLTIADRMLKGIWAKRAAHEGARVTSLTRKLAAVESEIDKLLDRVVAASTPSVIAAFENRIEKLEGEKSVLREMIAENGKPASNLEDVARTAFEFLKSPWNLWVSERLIDRQAVLKLTFQGQLEYARGEGYRTAQPTLPFTLFGLENVKNKVVPLAGLEPARLAATDFESAASTIPPQGHWSGISGLDVEDRARARQSAGSTGGVGLRRQTTLSFTSMLPRVALE